MERIDEFYTQLLDSEQSTIIHTDHTNTETLKAGEDTTSTTLAKLSEMRIRKTNTHSVEER